MDETNEDWLVNIISGSIDDDWYLDRQEEKDIKQDATRRGMAMPDIERILRRELEKSGSVSERVLLSEFDVLLHQYTDDDNYLDKAEEKDALEKVMAPAPGKKEGLDPPVAAEYMRSFCETHGVKKESDKKSSSKVVIALLIVMVVGGGIGYKFWKDKKGEDRIVEVEKEVIVEKEIVRDPTAYVLGKQDKAEIDDFYRRAVRYVEESAYTAPPAKSANAMLTNIRQIDPKGQYRGDEVRALVNRIVEEYIELADRSYKKNDIENVKQWLDRAKLFFRQSEVIRLKECELELIDCAQ